MNIIIDTNILISALLRDATARKLIIESPHPLLLPELIFEELRKHKSELLTKSGLSEDDYNLLILKILKYVELIPAEVLFPYKEKAKQIIGTIDPNDSPFIAAALAFPDSCIWSDDKHFRKQDEIRVLTTAEMFRMVS